MQDSQPTQNPLLEQTRGKQEQNRNKEVKGRKRWRLNRHKGGEGKTHTEEAIQPTTARETKQTGQGRARGKASKKKNEESLNQDNTALKQKPHDRKSQS